MMTFDAHKGYITTHDVIGVGSGNCGRPIPEILADSVPLGKFSSI